MTIVVAKIHDSVVQVVRYSDAVGFSTEKGWFMVCTDWQQPEHKKQHFSWMPANTRFDWVREFAS